MAGISGLAADRAQYLVTWLFGRLFSLHGNLLFAILMYEYYTGAKTAYT